MYADSRLHGLCGRAPDIIQKLDPGENLIGIGEQFIEKQEFFRRQCDRVVIPLNGQGVIVQHGLPDRKAVVRRDPGPP